MISVETYEEAIELLNSKSGTGELKIITSECEPWQCVLNPHYQTDYVITNPYHFILHDVTSIEVREDGLVVAHSDEKDWTIGNPIDLLKRLTEFEGQE